MHLANLRHLVNVFLDQHDVAGAPRAGHRGTAGTAVTVWGQCESIEKQHLIVSQQRLLSLIMLCCQHYNTHA